MDIYNISNTLPTWRNRIARKTSNLEVAGSSPAVGVLKCECVRVVKELDLKSNGS